MNASEFGNGSVIYTQSGYHAREFTKRSHAGMVGVNVGIPAPVAYLPFGGLKDSQWADVKAQGTSIVDFFTDKRIVTERYWPEKG